MSLQTDQRTGLGELEALDFDYDPSCELPSHGHDSRHSGPAWALVERTFPCGCGPRFAYVCKGVWENVDYFYCMVCRSGRQYSREQVWRFVALVRP